MALYEPDLLCLGFMDQLLSIYSGRINDIAVFDHQAQVRIGLGI